MQHAVIAARLRRPGRIARGTPAGALLLAMLLAASPTTRADGLLDDLAGQVERAVTTKAREVVECAANDRACEKKARKQGKDVRTVAPVPAPATPDPAPAQGGSAQPGTPVTPPAPANYGNNPYMQHALNHHPAYALANRIADAPSEREVAEALREALDRINVGIYAHDGRRIQAGAERKPTDFFLYDFQWKMLARAYHRGNRMSFEQHARMLGAGALALKDTAAMRDVLGKALERRYEEAVSRPDDANSFIVLLVDGLARRQHVPYGLDEPYRFDERMVAVDPIQSALIMIDFFTRPPTAKASLGWLDWLPAIVPAAHAAGLCDAIKGDDEQGYWGRGTDIIGEIGQELPGVTGKVFSTLGNLTGVTGALGDLLVLYGMSIELKPQPVFIHLNHAGEGSVAGIEATVSFDAQGVPDSVLKCGWLAGKQMPSNGGVKGVELTWDFSPVLLPQLQVHESMFDGYGDASDKSNHIIATADGLRTETDEGGKSIFVLQPNDCPRPDGMMREKNYMAMVSARYVTRGIPTPGLLGFGLILKLGPGVLEWVMGGRDAYARFGAQWHEKPPPRLPY